jgi:hypothetical protein
MAHYGVLPIVGNKLFADLDLNGYKISGIGEINTTGALIGGIKGVSKTASSVTLLASECYGHLIAYSGATAVTFTLPPVVTGMMVTIYAATAQIITVDPNDADRLILDGVAKADGVSITSPGGLANIITLYGDSVNGWTVISRGGTWS